MLVAAAETLRWLYWYAHYELTWGSVCVYGAIFLLSWLFSKLVIFPRLSPLKKIPGRPESLRHILVGHLPEILKKEAIDPYIEWVKEMKTAVIRYRHVMGAYRVLVADPEAFKDVLVTNAQYYPRPGFLARGFGRILGSSLLTLEGKEHSIQRRLCNSAFKLSAVQGLLPTFQKHAEKLCQKWTSAIEATKEGPTVVDFQTTIANFTFDIISEAGFGYQSNAIMDPQEKAANAFNYLLSDPGNRLLRIAIPRIYSKLPTQANKQFASSLHLLHSLIHGIIGKKEEAMAERSTAEKHGSMDLLEIMLSASDVESGMGLSKKQLQDHVMTFMLAGHETTASSLSWILLTLANKPEIQTKARQEVMSFLPPSGQPITYEDMEQMKYTACIIKEALRLFPPAPLVLREATKDMKLCGYDIPKGTVINLSIGALHRNPAYWTDPDEFIPERFLDESAIPLYSFQPFISGPHMCIGYKFSLMETRVALALLLKHFEFSHLPDVTYRKKQSITMRPSPPLKLNIRRLI